MGVRDAHGLVRRQMVTIAPKERNAVLQEESNRRDLEFRLWPGRVMVRAGGTQAGRQHTHPGPAGAQGGSRNDTPSPWLSSEPMENKISDR